MCIRDRFIAEPVVGAAAMGMVPDPAYFKRVREICDKYDVLMIVAEVLSGMGRTGKNFAIDHWGVTPDIITCGKGISSGYSVSYTHLDVYKRQGSWDAVWAERFTAEQNERFEQIVAAAKEGACLLYTSRCV